MRRETCMSRHEPLVCLQQMRDFAEQIVSTHLVITRQTLDEEFFIRQGVLKTIGDIGEAASRVPKELRPNYPGIDWYSIINMRHRIYHGYDNIDLNLVWDVVSHELPLLIEEIDRIFSATGVDPSK